MTLLSRKADYALLILSYLHQNAGGGTARAVEERFGIGRAFASMRAVPWGGAAEVTTGGASPQAANRCLRPGLSEIALARCDYRDTNGIEAVLIPEPHAEDES